MSRQNNRSNRILPAIGLAVLAGLALGYGRGTPVPAPGKQRVRLAYFPNVTHAPALVGIARGEFERSLPAGYALDPKVFNAGPEELEALLAGEIDVGYVGPSPAINTFIKSGGRALRVLAGACDGGAALVARAGEPIRGVVDLDGRRLAVPQLGGTQDVSARHFLSLCGLRTRDKGGTVEIIPVKNPDILVLMKRGELDAAWVPEPWASRLIAETGARLVVDERRLWPSGKFTSTVVVARTAFLQQKPELTEALLQAHLRSVAWLRQHPDDGQRHANDELKRLTGKALPVPVLCDAWSRVEFTADVDRESIFAFAGAAEAAGYLPASNGDLAAIFAPGSLERARQRLASVRR